LPVLIFSHPFILSLHVLYQAKKTTPTTVTTTPSAAVMATPGPEVAASAIATAGGKLEKQKRKQLQSKCAHSPTLIMSSSLQKYTATN